MKAIRICSFPECGRPLQAHGLCVGHVYQTRKGYPLTPIEPRRTGCEVEGCTQPHRSRGYCRLHYRRFAAHGDPEALLVIPDARERFELYYEKSDGCWLWTGVLSYDGYGRFRADNRSTGAHRFAYEYYVGPIPDGLQIDHLCRVHNCVNPAHLEPVTPAENQRRGREARQARTG